MVFSFAQLVEDVDAENSHRLGRHVRDSRPILLPAPKGGGTVVQRHHTAAGASVQPQLKRLRSRKGQRAVTLSVEYCYDRDSSTL